MFVDEDSLSEEKDDPEETTALIQQLCHAFIQNTLNSIDESNRALYIERVMDTFVHHYKQPQRDWRR